MDSHRIDVQHHILPQGYVSKLASLGITKAFGVDLPAWSPETTLAAMDRLGIQTAVACVSAPGFYFGDATFTRKLVRQCNEESASLVASEPTRFGMFAGLPLPDVQSTLDEIEYSMDTLQLDGICHFSNYDGIYLGDPRFDEAYAELNRRKAVVYVHPEDPPYASPLPQVPAYLSEVRYETTRAIINWIYSGAAERYPDIRFIFAHAGGTAPYLAWTIATGSFTIPGAKDKAPQGTLAYMKRYCYDTGLCGTPFALRTLQELVGPSQILYATDFPFCPEPLIQTQREILQSYDGFDDETLQLIERGNALSLFPRIAGLVTE